MKIFLISFVILVCSCSTVQKGQESDRFVYDFGTIIEDGDFYKVDDRSTTISWFPGLDEKKFGVRVENLSRNEYALGYVILRKDELNEQYQEVSKGGYWRIAPPNNEQYEAFMWEDSVPFTPGDYLFLVMINGEEASSFEFSIVWDKS